MPSSSGLGARAAAGTASEPRPRKLLSAFPSCMTSPRRCVDPYEESARRVGSCVVRGTGRVCSSGCMAAVKCKVCRYNHSPRSPRTAPSHHPETQAEGPTSRGRDRPVRTRGEPRAHAGGATRGRHLGTAPTNGYVPAPPRSAGGSNTSQQASEETWRVIACTYMAHQKKKRKQEPTTTPGAANPPSPQPRNALPPPPPPPLPTGTFGGAPARPPPPTRAAPPTATQTCRGWP